MKNRPFISVITPIKDLFANERVETFLQALKSIHEQEFDNFEHIIFDGGSTDGTVDYINSLKEQGFNFSFTSEQDHGPYDAMNRGARLSTGQYLIFLNSDDYYHVNNAFRLIYESAREKQPDFVCSPIRLQRNDKFHVKKVKFKNIFFKMPFGHPGLAVKRDIFFNLGGFNTEYKISADYDMIIKLLFSNFSYSIIATPFVTFRFGGLSSDTDRIKIEWQQIWTTNFANYGCSSLDADFMSRKRRLPRKLSYNMLRDRTLSGRLRWNALVKFLSIR